MSGIKYSWEVENEAHQRLPRTNVTDENIRVVCLFIEGCLTVSEIVSGVGIRLVLKLLLLMTLVTEQYRQDQQHLQVFNGCWSITKPKKNPFLQGIVTCDETWSTTITQKLNRQLRYGERKGKLHLIKPELGFQLDKRDGVFQYLHGNARSHTTLQTQKTQQFIMNGNKTPSLLPGLITM